MKHLSRLPLFLAVGLAITLASAASYWLLADIAKLDPNLSLAIVFAVFVVIGYFAHSSAAFRGHAKDEPLAVRLGRYAAVNTTGLIINEIFVYILVKMAGLPVLWSVAPMILVTPWLVFFLNRLWVFPEVSRER